MLPGQSRGGRSEAEFITVLGGNGKPSVAGLALMCQQFSAFIFTPELGASWHLGTNYY